MGMAKRELARQEDVENSAIRVAVQAGALKSCLLHEDIVIDQWDSDALQRAYAIGTNLWKTGEIDATREEFMEAIKEAVDQSAESCWICDKHAASD